MQTNKADNPEVRNILMDLKEKWPSNVVARPSISNFTGGALSPGTMANADSKGEGPVGAFKVGRNIVYPIDSLIEWLLNRTSKIRKSPYRYLAESRKAKA